MIKALVFDCYGTLISTGNSSIEATQKILTNIGSNIDPVIFYKTWKNIHKEHQIDIKPFCLEKKIFLKDLKLLFEKYNIKNSYKKNIKPMFDALYGRRFYDDVIVNLKNIKNYYDIFIASNSDTKPLLENIGNEKYLFNGIFTSEKLKAYKPSIMFFERLFEKIKYDKNEILFIGDSIDDDIKGSNKVGIKNILVNRKDIDTENCIANYIVKDFYELNKILKNKLM
jgi:2-haloalkanoic acid dehalogenase type II